MILIIMSNVSYLSHGFYIVMKKNRASMLKHTRPRIILLFGNYLDLAALPDTAAAQITRPNAILFIKSAKL